MEYSIRNGLHSEDLDAMDFLNEAMLRYPKAISFAAGRPNDAFADPSLCKSWIDIYTEYRSRSGKRKKEDELISLGQYSKTNGIINDLIAAYVENDLGVSVPAESVVVTNGCQEAMLISLMALFEPGKDVLVVRDPTYTGIVGSCALANIEVIRYKGETYGEFEDFLLRTSERLGDVGKRVGGYYIIPEYDNPTGKSVKLAERECIVSLSNSEDFYVLEDSPYRIYRYGGEDILPLIALPGAKNVIYLGTFAKTLMPGLRIGFILADQIVQSEERQGRLAESFSKIKSYVSVNTSPLLQAAVGGILIQENFSLKSWNRDVVDCYRGKLNLLLQLLESRFGDTGSYPGLIDWENPGGGFFIILTLPFPFGSNELQECGSKFEVIVCPMYLFSDRDEMNNKVRLSFSNPSLEEIRIGFERFSEFLLSRCGTGLNSIVW